MSEVRGNQVFTATMASGEPLEAARLVEFLGTFDALYRSIRWMVSLNDDLLALESFVQAGTPMSDDAFDRVQRAIDVIWGSLPDGEIRGIPVSSSPMIQYSGSTMETLNEPGYGLTISWIEMRSPLKIGVVNVVVAAVVIAAIFSGGTFECGSMSVKLPPIGQGIAALREALKPMSDGKKAAPRLQDHIEKI